MKSQTTNQDAAATGEDMARDMTALDAEEAVPDAVAPEEVALKDAGVADTTKADMKRAGTTGIVAD